MESLTNHPRIVSFASPRALQESPQDQSHLAEASASKARVREKLIERLETALANADTPIETAPMTASRSVAVIPAP